MNKHHSLSPVHKQPDRSGKCHCCSLLGCRIARIEEQGISAKGENCRSCQIQSPLDAESRIDLDMDLDMNSSIFSLRYGRSMSARSYRT